MSEPLNFVFLSDELSETPKIGVLEGHQGSVSYSLGALLVHLIYVY